MCVIERGKFGDMDWLLVRIKSTEDSARVYVENL